MNLCIVLNYAKKYDDKTLLQRQQLDWVGAH